uniref:Uncharacterized protein n=1 Tax=Vitis vinifera TaxID=29760 RepID=A5BTT0_VITVI|nr:hypothetical protein VITISV_029082 [Vitis vinifera]
MGRGLGLGFQGAVLEEVVAVIEADERAEKIVSKTSVAAESQIEGAPVRLVAIISELNCYHLDLIYELQSMILLDQQPRHSSLDLSHYLCPLEVVDSDFELAEESQKCLQVHHAVSALEVNHRLQLISTVRHGLNQEAGSHFRQISSWMHRPRDPSEVEALIFPHTSLLPRHQQIPAQRASHEFQSNSQRRCLHERHISRQEDRRLDASSRQSCGAPFFLTASSYVSTQFTSCDFKFLISFVIKFDWRGASRWDENNRRAFLITTTFEGNMTTLSALNGTCCGVESATLFLASVPRRCSSEHGEMEVRANAVGGSRTSMRVGKEHEGGKGGAVSAVCRYVGGSRTSTRVGKEVRPLPSVDMDVPCPYTKEKTSEAAAVEKAATVEKAAEGGIF